MQPDYASIHHRKTHILYNLEKPVVQFIFKYVSNCTIYCKNCDLSRYRFGMTLPSVHHHDINVKTTFQSFITVIGGE